MRINDDTAEKKNRRKSLVDDRKRRRSVAPGDLTPHRAALNALPASVATPPPLISQEELSRNYEAWMKIAADNVHPFITECCDGRKSRWGIAGPCSLLITFTN